MSTPKDILSSTVSHYTNEVCCHLSEWLKSTKGVEVSAQELTTAFGVPYTPRVSGLPQAGNLTPQVPYIPPHMQGTGAETKSKKEGEKTTGRKKAQTDPNAPKCQYKFQRGNREGEVCGEAVDVANSEEYCKNCLKKKTVINKVKGGAAGKSTVQAPSAPGGLVSMPNVETTEDDSAAIRAVPIEGHSNLFKDLDNNFIILQQSDGSLVARFVDDNGTQRPLNAQERVLAQSKGLCLVDNSPSVSASHQTISAPPSGPSVVAPTIPMMPPVVPIVPAMP